MSLQPCYNFWSQLFNLSEADLKNPASAAVSRCRYIDKYGDDYIFRFQDLTTQKIIFAASVANLEKCKLQADEISSQLNLIYDDIDYCLDLTADFNPAKPSENLKICLLNVADTAAVETFFKTCSEEDADVLDLNLETDIAFGALCDGQLIGISRYVVIKNTSVADITVAISENQRGRGYAKPLVSAVVEHILAAKLSPKYRVKADLHASARVAIGLGFKPRFKLQTFEVRKS